MNEGARASTIAISTMRVNILIPYRKDGWNFVILLKPCVWVLRPVQQELN